MFKKVLKVVVPAALCLAVFLPAIPATKADTISVIPPRFDLFGNPGDILTEKVRISNDTDTAVTYDISAEDFRAEGDDGSVALIEDGQAKTSYSLANWITPEPSRIEIPAGQEKVVTVNIRIPRNGEPGGHYATVLIRRPGDATPGGASVESRVGSLILLRVSGDVKEKARLDSFEAENGYQQTGPVKFKMRFTNEGNVHVQPAGTIVITNMFGKKVKEFDYTPANVLPGASRVVETTLDEKRLIGRYTATLVSSYGQQKLTLTGTTSFIVFPIYLMFVIVGGIILVALLVVNRKKIRRAINNLTRE